MLHFVQDGLNVKLNSWSLPFDFFCSRKQRLSKAPIGYSSFHTPQTFPQLDLVAAAVGEVEMLPPLQHFHFFHSHIHPQILR
jgi:hypothetical protein